MVKHDKIKARATITTRGKDTDGISFVRVRGYACARQLYARATESCVLSFMSDAEDSGKESGKVSIRATQECRQGLSLDWALSFQHHASSTSKHPKVIPSCHPDMRPSLDSCTFSTRDMHCFLPPCPTLSPRPALLRASGHKFFPNDTLSILVKA